LAASAALQSPVSCTWKPWLLPGASPPMSPVTRTPSRIGVSVNLPLTRLPEAPARLLVATAAVPVDGVTVTGALVGGAAAQAESTMAIIGVSRLGRMDVSCQVETDAVRRRRARYRRGRWPGAMRLIPGAACGGARPRVFASPCCGPGPVARRPR